MTRVLRVVFICAQNKLRSPTAEAIFRSTDGWEVTSAGTNRDAETPVSRDLLEWADVAVSWKNATATSCASASEESCRTTAS